MDPPHYFLQSFCVFALYLSTNTEWFAHTHHVTIVNTTTLTRHFYGALANRSKIAPSLDRGKRSNETHTNYWFILHSFLLTIVRWLVLLWTTGILYHYCFFFSTRPSIFICFFAKFVNVPKSFETMRNIRFLCFLLCDSLFVYICHCFLNLFIRFQIWSFALTNILSDISYICCRFYAKSFHVDAYYLLLFLQFLFKNNIKEY